MEAGVTVLLTVMVGLFGLTSAVLGFIAEAQSLTPSDIHVSGSECVYPANPAHALGVCAILLLAVAQITASAAGGCCGCCRPGGGASKSTRRVVGVIVAMLSWIMAMIAVLYYWKGVEWNAPGTHPAAIAGGNEECVYFKDGGFTRAAILSLVATSLAIKSFFLLRAPASTPEALEGADEPKADGQHPPEAGVAVGLPQWPAPGNGHAPYSHPAQG
ncbi:uncharacterized protein [Setaria viridis]|uniref:Uncharacterized protein n=1 Tax=Setaria viridis TaxID=4556 RepID=A0A4U6VCD0_SETVI|nr:uncharacterized protein LOC117849101 [Setaria viridis]TKW27090.1 hypothetical protein SEVIR_3G234900v2 [Setaria viridis]